MYKPNSVSDDDLQAGRRTPEVPPGTDLDGSVLSTGIEPPALQYGPLDTAFKTFSRWMSYLAAVALGVVTVVCFVDVIGSKFLG